MKKRIILFLTFLILVLPLFACGTSTIDEDLAPMFELKDLEGNQVNLKDFAGEKVYVKYWASWCSICLAGLDELNTLATVDNNFTIISIVSPKYKAEKSSVEFIKWFDGLEMNPLTVLLDENGAWAKAYGVLSYPTSYYIGTEGTLVQTAIGHQSNEVIINTFKEMD